VAELLAAEDAFATALRDFLMGRPAVMPTRRTILDTLGPGPVIGELGGHRDRILRSTFPLGQGLGDVIRAATGQPRRSDPNPAAQPAPSSPPSGRISGQVVDTNGDPSANVLISFHYFGPNPPANRGGSLGRYSGAIPATVTDDQGRFTLGDLPPGHYQISGSLAAPRREWELSFASQQTVQVRENTETKLSASQRLQ